MRDGTRARLQALGQQLVVVHDGLRADLDRLRTALDAGEDVAAARTLPQHCLAFCAALGRHHRSEDADVFPALGERHPELAEVLARLREDHAVIAGLLTSLAASTDALPAHPDADQRSRFRAELDGVGALMESHFRFEERRIRSALDAWTDAPAAGPALVGVVPPGPG
jgi:hemerythrin HHE cation binding domain-containing protein